MHHYPRNHLVALFPFFKRFTLPACICVYHVYTVPTEPEEVSGTPNPNYKLQLVVIMSVLGTKPWSSAIVVSASNWLVIFPDHFICFLIAVFKVLFSKCPALGCTCPNLSVCVTSKYLIPSVTGLGSWELLPFWMEHSHYWRPQIRMELRELLYSTHFPCLKS